MRPPKTKFTACCLQWTTVNQNLCILNALISKSFLWIKCFNSVIMNESFKYNRIELEHIQVKFLFDWWQSIAKWHVVNFVWWGCVDLKTPVKKLKPSSHSCHYPYIHPCCLFPLIDCCLYCVCMTGSPWLSADEWCIISSVFHQTYQHFWYTGINPTDFP